MLPQPQPKSKLFFAPFRLKCREHPRGLTLPCRQNILYKKRHGNPDKRPEEQSLCVPALSPAAAPFVRQPGREYALRAEAKGEVLTLFVNGTPVLEASDSRYAYGMPGLGLTAAGETLWRALHISGEC